MVHYTLGDKQFSMPASYGELTYNQLKTLTRLPDPDNFLSVLTVLTRITKEEWDQCPDLDVDNKLAPFMQYLNEAFDPVFILPSKIEIKGVWYDLPGGIGVNTFGQKIALQRAIARIEKEGIEEIDIYPYVVALYMQPTVTKLEYNEDKVEALIPDIMECKLNELFPIAGFFLKNCEKSLTKKRNDSVTLRPVKKSGRESINLKSSESYQRYGLLRGALIKVLRRFSWKGTTLFT